jgi:hypothetical protein
MRFPVSRRVLVGGLLAMTMALLTALVGQGAQADGSWLAGVDNARSGLIMPGTILLGARYHQEMAPRVAMDRAEIISLNEVVRTPAGTFRKVLRTDESTPLDPGVVEPKFYAPGIGLIQDGALKLKVVRVRGDN